MIRFNQSIPAARTLGFHHRLLGLSNIHRLQLPSRSPALVRKAATLAKVCQRRILPTIEQAARAAKLADAPTAHAA